MALPTDLYIDNMVCDRCKSAVRQVLTNLGWRIEQLDLGRVRVIRPGGDGREDVLRQQLETLGFRLRNPAGGIVTRIKGIIIEYVYDDAADATLTLAELLTGDLGYSYPHLSRTFSQAEGRTVTEYYLTLRMERARQLLATTDEPVNRVAERLHYGSAARFAAAFRRATGMAPTAFRESRSYRARPLDEL